MRTETYLRTSVTDGDKDRMVKVSGELDLASTGDLEAACRTPPGKNLMLDLSDVEFIDVAGLRALLALRPGDERLTLVSPSKVVRRLITLAGSLDAFVLIDQVEEPVG